MPRKTEVNPDVVAMRGYGYHVWTKGAQTLWCSCSRKKDHAAEPVWNFEEKA